MYELQPRGLFVHRRVFDNPLATARFERIVTALGSKPADVPVIGESDIDTILDVAGATDAITTAEIIKGGHGRFRQGHLKLDYDPVMIFNTFVWDPEQRTPIDRKFGHPRANQTYRMLCGVGKEFAYSNRPLFMYDAPKGYVCQGGWGIHSLQGCVHRCGYCGEGFIVQMLLDLEDFATDLRRVFRERPEQKLYRWDLFSDQLCFEPEYGGTEVIGGCFNETDDKYLLLYTKSDNVDHLLSLPYQDHVLSNWTISTDDVCRQIELATPTLAERIEAMRKCQQAGYTIRAGFTPIIPLQNWRDETTKMIELLFSRCEPEVLRLWVVSMMEVEELVDMFGEENLDPWCLQRAREDQPEMTGAHHAPFPLDVRCEIYSWYIDEIRRVSPHTPVALCTERLETWDRLEHKLQMKRNSMFCCCGGTSVPGGWQSALPMV